MIARAVELLREGRLVAFPTETVYGLGADATNHAAIARIFAAKGRPSTNPLICHVTGEAMAQRYAIAWPESASKIARQFWPGPVTIVVRKTDAIPFSATAGRDSVGLRAPNHPMAMELIAAFDRPIAGPSANKSNHVSPTTAQHVRDELGVAVDLILDGGPCAVGIESTVLDLSGDVPTILRPGGVRRDQIAAIIGTVDVLNTDVSPGTPAASPGQQARHYAPRTPAIRVEADELSPEKTRHRGFMIFEWMDRPCIPTHIFKMPHNPVAYARDFYLTLRELDALELEQIVIEMPPDTPEWAAVRDRITRATTLSRGFKPLA